MAAEAGYCGRVALVFVRQEAVIGLNTLRCEKRQADRKRLGTEGHLGFKR
jgi:hypothetical protein